MPEGTHVGIIIIKKGLTTSAENPPHWMVGYYGKMASSNPSNRDFQYLNRSDNNFIRFGASFSAVFTRFRDPRDFLIEFSTLVLGHGHIYILRNFVTAIQLDLPNHWSGWLEITGFSNRFAINCEFHLILETLMIISTQLDI